jgi:GNAT superfamily N-acetyltransferase
MPDDVIEIRADGETIAKCALWWSSTPQLDGHRVGYVGRYERTDERAARAMLQRALERLAGAGCGIAVGPVDGSTWYPYRFVTERGDRPPFFLEPENPDAYPEDFRQAGFAPLAHYVSAEETPLRTADERADRAAERLQRGGVRIRHLDLERYAEELDAIYDVACASFAGALLFSPITRPAFRALYEPLRSYVDPDFVRIAEHDGRAVGFAFGIPDVSALGRGHAVDTIVGKTQAVLPELRYGGLGTVMLNDVRRSAQHRGMRRIIHALIRDGNVAFNGSSRVAASMRGYTVYARGLK